MLLVLWSIEQTRIELLAFIAESLQIKFLRGVGDCDSVSLLEFAVEKESHKIFIFPPVPLYELNLVVFPLLHLGLVGPSRLFELTQLHQVLELIADRPDRVTFRDVHSESEHFHWLDRFYRHCLWGSVDLSDFDCHLVGILSAD